MLLNVAPSGKEASSTSLISIKECGVLVQKNHHSLFLYSNFQISRTLKSILSIRMMFCNIFMLEFEEEEGGQIDSQKCQHELS